MAVRNSKALIGALFIQWIFFGFFYILDELFNLAPNHYRAVDNKEREAEKVGGSGSDPQQNVPGANGKNKKKKASGTHNKTYRRELTEREKRDLQQWEQNRLKSVTNEIVEYFPKVMLFHSVFVVFNAYRSPTDAAVIFTYFAIILRVLMVFGWYCNKKSIYMGFAAGEFAINCALFFITVTYHP